MITSPTHFTLPVPLDKVDQGHDYRAQGRDHRPRPAGDGDRQPAAGPDQGPAVPGGPAGGTCRRAIDARAREAEAWRPTHRAFRDPDFLADHIQHTMAFYHPRCIDQERAASSTSSRTTARIYDADTRHLVSSTRFVFNYAMACRHFGDADVPRGRPPRRGLPARGPPQPGDRRLCLARWDDGDEVLDGTNHCYGLAFVVLAYAKALEAGIEEARAHLEETWQLMERHFWSEADGLYRDEISADWQTVSPYRGQNANMHSCEAMLAAFEATGDAQIPGPRRHGWPTASPSTSPRKAGRAGLGALRPDWHVDWDYNRDDPKHMFRPWGYPARPSDRVGQAAADPGAPSPRRRGWLPTARAPVRHRACERAWDAEHGGICYGFAPGRHDLRRRQVFLGAGRELRRRGAAGARAPATSATGTGTTGSGTTAWQHIVDHQYGAWYRILDQRQPQVQRREKPGRQDRLPHDGRLLRGAERGG